MYSSSMSTRLSYVDISAMIICNPISLTPDPKDYVLYPPLNPFTAAEETYSIGDPTLKIKFKEFVSAVDCKSPITYTYSLDNYDPLPVFVTVQAGSGKSGGGTISIQTDTRASVTVPIYKVKVTASMMDGIYQESLLIPIKFLVPNTGAPTF
jgi:hypothetical protein